MRGIDELGREEELDGASDVLEQFRSELFGEKILTRRGDILGRLWSGLFSDDKEREVAGRREAERGKRAAAQQVGVGRARVAGLR
jgi:hypothetical protein